MEVALKSLTRNARLGAFALTSLLAFTACTPEQIQHITLDPDIAAVLAPLDDVPLKLSDGSTLELDGTITPPPVTDCSTARAKTDAIRYRRFEPAPALEAFRLIAVGCRGWTHTQVDSWLIAAKDIMRGESFFCPNVFYGSRVDADCRITRQGKGGAAGFAQLVSVHYKPGRWLCTQERLCSKWDIVASPSNSMTAMLAMIERSGVQPWCYSKFARRYHRTTCNNPGMNVP